MIFFFVLFFSSSLEISFCSCTSNVGSRIEKSFVGCLSMVRMVSLLRQISFFCLLDSGRFLSLFSLEVCFEAAIELHMKLELREDGDEPHGRPCVVVCVVD